MNFSPGNRFRFELERFILRGAHYRLLVIGAVIGLVSLGAGVLVYLGTAEFSSGREGIWWAFLRLTDPGYLGDDKGVVLRAVSTVVTVLGYVLFMGSLIAILTQWLDQTIRLLESGVTPIARRNHVVVLGWTNRTPAVVREILQSEGRVRRFLRRHGARRLCVVVLSEEVTTRRRYELREALGPHWDETRIILRSGTPLRPEHLRRVDFMNAAVLILPGSEVGQGGPDAADMRTIKTLLSVSNMGAAQAARAMPYLVAEIFDARKIPVAREAYDGRIEILASDSMVSLLIAQNVRHRWLSHVYTELLTHGEDSNEIYVRACPELAGQALQDLGGAFPRAILLGVLRREPEGLRPILNPPGGFRAQAEDHFVFVARSYADAAPAPGFTPVPAERGVGSAGEETLRERRVLLMGWNEKVPALINEFDTYENEAFQIDVLSTIPVEQRDRKMARYAMTPRRVRIRHLDGDYAAPADLARIRPETYDNVVVVGCDWLDSTEEADARTILGRLLLRRILANRRGKPDVLLELLDPENRLLFEHEADEVLISPLILSHILAHVALRPDLNAVFYELFSSGGAEIFFRPVGRYGLVGSRRTFRAVQKAVLSSGETAVGVRIEADRRTVPGGVHLNPERDRSWTFSERDEVVVVSTYV